MSALSEQIGRECGVPECAKRTHAKGYCGSHYQRLVRYGDPLGTPSPPPSPAERFEASYLVDESGCWIWTALLDSNGYGSFWIDGRNRTAHRVGWEMLHGPVAEGLELDHLCRNRECVNPDHLEPVTHAENVRRGARGYGARDLCRSGLHSIRDPENVYLGMNGSRRCRACLLQGVKRRREADPDALTKERERSARYRAKKRAARIAEGTDQ